jgi:hypothetical protein
MLPGHRFQLFRLAKPLSPARLGHFSFSISLRQFFCPVPPKNSGSPGWIRQSWAGVTASGFECTRNRPGGMRHMLGCQIVFLNSSHLFLPPDNFLFNAVKTEAGPQSALELTRGLNFLFGKAFLFSWYDNK